MTTQLDLLKIAQEEQNGDLFKLLDSIYQRSKVQPRGYTDAVIWEGGNAAGGVKPVAHAFTDMFALNGTLMALDVLGLPFLGVPMMAQFRHDTKLVSLDWFGKLEYTALKALTEADRKLADAGTTLWLVALNPNVQAVVERSPLGPALGPDRIFPAKRLAVDAYCSQAKL